MSVGPVSLPLRPEPASGGLGRLVAALPDLTTVTAAGFSLALIGLVSPGTIVQDTWSTLVAGRLVATAGIPHHELLTAWAHGRTWIDQQWLAQLVSYRVMELGGLPAVVVSSALLSGLAWLGAILYARRRGASGLALTVWGPAALLVAPWALQARAQSFALPLFVALLVLVFADSRKRSPRIILTLPLIALWGNVHGTALLGACVLALHAGMTVGQAVVDRTRVAQSVLRAAALAGGGFLALAANPYGLASASYYRTMLLNPPFATMIAEWRHSGLSTTTLPFYALALIGLGVAIRHRKRLTPTEAAVLLFLFVSGVDAIRSIVWFAVATLLLLPPLVRSRKTLTIGRFAAPARVGLLVGTVAALVGTVGILPGTAASRFTRDWSTRGSDALRIAVAADPAARVFADDRHSDFLLWQAPELQGRMVADVRFELLTRREVIRLAQFESKPRPQDAPAPFVVLDPRIDALAPWRTAGWKQLYVDRSIAVYERRVP